MNAAEIPKASYTDQLKTRLSKKKPLKLPLSPTQVIHHLWGFPSISDVGHTDFCQAEVFQNRLQGSNYIPQYSYK